MDVALNLVGIIGQRLVVKKDKKGRTAIIDLLINNAAVQDLIFKGELMVTSKTSCCAPAQKACKL